MKWMEKSKRSEATLAVRMKHEDDCGMNEDSNLSHSVRASNKEDSQRTTTLTDNKKRDYENEGSSMHNGPCIGIIYAHRFPKCFRSLSHIVGIFAVYVVSSIQLLSLYQFNQFLTCTRIPCRDSHCENGSLEVLSLHKYRSRRQNWRDVCTSAPLLAQAFHM